MIRALPAPLRGVLMGMLLVLNTLLVAAGMLLPALVKLVAPQGALRSACDRALTALASSWVGVNSAWVAAVSAQAWDIHVDERPGALNPRGWYLVSPNHQSWVDILVLQRVFHRRIPFLKFFLKKELIWVPVIGLAWWALDFPFMARGRGSGARHADLATTRAACEKFRHMPTTVINFVEGTRLTAAKHTAQGSPYRHLLKPKVGGLAVALATMGEMFECVLDVTIIYPDGTPDFWQLLCGRVGRVVVRVQQRPIPADLVGRDLLADPALRQQLNQWIEQQWQDKDALVAQVLAQHRDTAG